MREIERAAKRAAAAILVAWVTFAGAGRPLHAPVNLAAPKATAATIER